ncbi:MAG: DUF2723 domain-containing protein [Marinilabiliales bacterium]|nr:DUF2723 domain-containing protein [Marinilabiliales bacterium]
MRWAILPELPSSCCWGASLRSLPVADTSKVAMMVNILSAFASAFTILFLFWTITRLIRLATGDDGSMLQAEEQLLVIASGATGALAYAFSDTFWFSAVEGEVYATSSLFTAAVFWAMLRWYDEADEPHANRWIILIALSDGTFNRGAPA